MNKLLIVSASVLFVAGFISMAWAHGPNGSGSGYRSYGHSKPHFNRPSYPRIHLRHNQHFRHQSHNKHYGHQRHHRHYKPYYSPLAKSYDYDYEASLPRENSRPVPRHTHSSHIYYNNNPEPWFLYGKGKQLRQMGIIPPLPQTSRGLK